MLKKGQSIRNICNLYKSQLPVSDRTIYNYMHERVLSADLFDLKRTVQRKERKKPGPALLVDKKCRNGRLYSDFLEYINENPDINVVEIDTVEGTRGGKSLLTLYFRNCNLQLAFLEEKNVVQNININRDNVAPVQKGQKFGEITFSLNGEVLSSTNIVAKEDINKIGTLNMIKFVYGNWFNLLRNM